MNVLITAGGTVAPIDDVRVISNRSTGRFAASLAEAWLRRGASVTYLATTPRTFGPLEIPAMRVDGPVDPHELRRRTMQAITDAWHFDGRLQRVDLQTGTVLDYATELERLCRSRRWEHRPSSPARHRLAAPSVRRIRIPTPRADRLHQPLRCRPAAFLRA